MKWNTELQQAWQFLVWIKAFALIMVLKTQPIPEGKMHPNTSMPIHNNDIHAPGYLGQGKTILTTLLIHNSQTDNIPWTPVQQPDIHLRWVDLNTNLTLKPLGGNSCIRWGKGNWGYKQIFQSPQEGENVGWSGYEQKGMWEIPTCFQTTPRSLMYGMGS